MGARGRVVVAGWSAHRPYANNSFFIQTGNLDQNIRCECSLRGTKGRRTRLSSRNVTRVHERGVYDRFGPASGFLQAPGVRDVAPHGPDASLLQLPGRLVRACEARVLVAGGDQGIGYPGARVPRRPVTSMSMPLLPAASSEAETLPRQRLTPPVVLSEGGYRITLRCGRWSYPVAASRVRVTFLE
jgi:hypothetical protein